MKKKKSNLSAKRGRVGTLLMLVILLQSFGIGVSRAQSNDEPRLTVEFSEAPFIDVINYIKRDTCFQICSCLTGTSSLFGRNGIYFPLVSEHDRDPKAAEDLRARYRPGKSVG